MLKESIGEHTIYCGDCREILSELPRFDAVVTDPPYGIGEAAGKNKTRGKLAISQDYGNDDWDNEPPSKDLIDLIVSKANNSIIFGGNYFVLPPSSCWLVWDKDNGECDFADCELAWTNLNKAVRRLKFRWAGMLQENMGAKEKRVHPTQKPIPVMRWCMSHLPENIVVLDPFMGSGTTGVACVEVGNTFVGIEREQKYFDIARKRIELAYNESKQRLF